jgi:type II secretory pathway component PulF
MTIEPTDEAELHKQLQPLSWVIENRMDISRRIRERLPSIPPRLRREIQGFLSVLETKSLLDDYTNNAVYARWIEAMFPLGDHRPFDEQFESICKVLERDLRPRISGVSWYVMSTFVVLLAVTCFLLSEVVPVYAQMYRGFGLRLLPVLQVLTPISDIFAGRGWLMFSTAIASCAMLWLAYRTGSRLLGELKHISFFSSAFTPSSSHLSSMSRFAGTLAVLLENRVSLRHACLLAAKASQSIYIFRSHRSLVAPSNSTPRRQGSELPATLRFAMTADRGEPCVPLLRELALIYAERSQMRSILHSSMIAPLTIFAFGFCVAALVVLLFLPMISLTSALAGG